ncbi:DUF3618 domain-containing protein [Dactylosporangium sp. CA-139066]|uniref:DUF3618 domain-containing protein n=1 Tax=Dactylosporangium sp. CA-139066 TaxID=3239930 RepID=UPI003D94B145
MSGKKTSADPGRLKEEIAETRDELAGTVEALAAKTDVKARAKDAAADVKERAKDAAADVKDAAVVAAEQVRRPVPAVALAAGIGLVALAIIAVRRRRS